MKKIRVIKTKEDYDEALKLIKDLVGRDPDPDSAEGEQLSLISTLLHDYEAKNFPSSAPDPLEAIRFRMEQSGLQPADLIPYLGSRSRVSEILSGKRQLTVDMIRALSEGLGIPAKVLIRRSDSAANPDFESWSTRLIVEMEKRGYFGRATLKTSTKSELLTGFFSSSGQLPKFAVLHRKSHYRSSPLSDRHALAAWATHVIKSAQGFETPKKYRHGIVDLRFMQELAKLSVEETGPLLAQEVLRQNGIKLIVEGHLPKTYLDGAAILIRREHPVVGLTLRHDRLDNFWFTLMHELAHIALHFDQDINLFYDELEGVKGTEINTKEQEADSLAEEALLPKAKWEVSPARLIPSSMAAKSLANELGVHVAIVAGQIRHKGNRYIYLNKIVNQAKVRKFFTR